MLSYTKFAHGLKTREHLHLGTPNTFVPFRYNQLDSITICKWFNMHVNIAEQVVEYTTFKIYTK